MGMDALSLALFFYPQYPQAEALSRAKSLVPILINSGEKRLSVFETSAHLMDVQRDEKFEAGHKDLVLDDWTEDSDVTRTVRVSHYDDAGWAVLSVTFSIIPYDRATTERTWKGAQQLAPRLVREAKPTFAVLTGLTDWPDPAKLKSGQLPPLGPWNWFSTDSLPDTRRKQLASIPGVYRFEQVAEGFLLQLVPDVYASPSSETTAAIAKLGTRYNAPKPPPRE
jgi:hypothetical protein